MTKITHDNAVRELINRIPEFKNYLQFHADDLDSPTLIFDDFGDFLLDRILSSSPEDPVTKRSFDFINEMQESEDPDVQNLPQVGVFEVLVGSEKAVRIAEKLLNKHGLYWFNRIKNFKP